jgi:hypothetical protein
LPNSFIIKSTLITSAVILVGVLIVVPAFLEDRNKTQILLSFDLIEEKELGKWCENLSNYSKEKSIPLTILIYGELAENYPNCITSFGRQVDVGSKTYSKMVLPSETDYLKQFDEVRKGKETIDKIGNLDSKIFKAPGMKTDENIYSLLSRNGIEFDLSYYDHYNKLVEEKFLRFDLVTSKWNDIDSIRFSKLDKSIPVLIEFDSSVSVEKVKEIVDTLKKKNVNFITPSDLMGKKLSIRN